MIIFTLTDGSALNYDSTWKEGGRSLLIMKYFDKEWSSGYLAEELTDQRYEDYWKLPFGFKLLAKHINLHDAVIKKIYLNRQNKTAILECECGDLQVGYFYLIIKYLDIFNTTNPKNLGPSKKYRHDRN